jgi:hypothetical protein
MRVVYIAKQKRQVDEREKERVGALEESWDWTPHLTEFKDISMLVMMSKYVRLGL